VAVKRRLKLGQTKPKAEKEKDALEKHFNRTTSENAQKAQEEPHHLCDEVMPGSQARNQRGTTGQLPPKFSKTRLFFC